MKYTKLLGNFEDASGIQLSLDSTAFRDSIFVTKKNYISMLKDPEFSEILKRRLH